PKSINSFYACNSSQIDRIGIQVMWRREQVHRVTRKHQRHDADAPFQFVHSATAVHEIVVTNPIKNYGVRVEFHIGSPASPAGSCAPPVSTAALPSVAAGASASSERGRLGRTSVAT